MLYDIMLTPNPKSEIKINRKENRNKKIKIESTIFDSDILVKSSFTYYFVNTAFI